MTDVGLLAAFAAGVLALLSPCSALILPSFFAYAFSGRTALLGRTVLFYLGLLVTLVPLGTGAAAASRLFYGHRDTLIAVAGWTIIALGVLMIVGRGFALPFAGRLQTWGSRVGGDRTSWLSTFVLGAVYGLAGFCSGPILGAILTVAATSGNPLTGGTLLAVYALGMAAPLFAMAALWDRFSLGSRPWVRGRMVRLGPVEVHTTSLITGLLFVAIGALFLVYDGTAGITGAFGLGDMTEVEMTAQQAVTHLTSAIPAWALPLVIAVVAALVARSRARRPERRAVG